MRESHVAIVGGGIGGLTAALSLQQAGLRASVFERAPGLREVGAGLVVSGSSMRGLDFLGVGDRVRSLAGKKPLNGLYFDLKHYATGEIIQEAQDVPGAGESYAVHRADLQSALKEAVLKNDPGCIFLDHEFESLSQDSKSVTATFRNGVTARADALVGCDGVASSVRPFLFGPEPTIYTGKVSFRGLIPERYVTPEIATECGSFYIGPERMLVVYYVRQTEFLNVVGHARQPGWEEEGWSIPAGTSDFLSLYDDFCPSVHKIIGAIPQANLFKWALRDRQPMQQWTVGRVSLLGDAAHPMLPFLGQGGNMAMEDGVVLGRCLGVADDIETGLARYQAARHQRANGVQIASRARAESLMDFSDPDALPLKDSGASRDYDPARVAV